MTSSLGESVSTEAGPPNIAPALTNGVTGGAVQRTANGASSLATFAKPQPSLVQNGPAALTPFATHVGPHIAHASWRTVAMEPATPRSVIDETPRAERRALQEWEGVVLEVRENGFSARLSDKTQKERSDEEADFPFAEVSDDDRKLVEPGAIFRWIIGFLTWPGGQKYRTSLVVFRRLPVWTKAEIQEADRLAEKLVPSSGRGEHSIHQEHEARRAK